MEVELYNSSLCRLCGEENENGILLYSSYENDQKLSDLVNTYLPIKVYDDGHFPRTICPGCNIQLEATMEFIDLIIKGQKLIRELHQRQIYIKKNDKVKAIDDNGVYEINTNGGVYQLEHQMALKVAGIDKPKRKRGRPPKKPKSPEELALETMPQPEPEKVITVYEDREPTGKRKRKTPTRFKEAVQGKELERIFKEEGVIDGEESDPEIKTEFGDYPVKKVFSDSEIMEVIGHSETSGELVVVVKGKGRGRPKGRLRVTKQECAICGMEFSCVGRYMSHIAQHGPVMYQCKDCLMTFTARLNFNLHQEEQQHVGQIIIPCGDKCENSVKKKNKSVNQSPVQKQSNQPEPEPDPQATNLMKTPEETTPSGDSTDTVQQTLPEISVNNIPSQTSLLLDNKLINTDLNETIDAVVLEKEVNECIEITSQVKETQIEEDTNLKVQGKPKLKCNLCEKTFSNRQSKSMHMKATHAGERPYVCKECGATFPYPRSLSLHILIHRRTNTRKGFACDLCGKVLNHPSSVVYHKEAEHAGQRYSCSKCNKTFKHKQLLQRHQLVHSHLRPYVCKVCTASFKTKANLVNHQRLHSGMKRYSCDLCKQKFSHKTSLTLHMRWHSGQKPFSCTVCNKSFTQKGNLSEHMRIHTGEKPYKCEECSRSFTTSSQYRLHLRRHTGERPYPCSHCGKRFVSRESWRGHMRREEGTRAHRCECGRAFSERWALHKHRRSHTGERPFKCPFCTRAFADSSNLNKHKKQVHKQISLLSSSTPSPGAPLTSEQTHDPDPDPDPALEERVILVTYDMHSGDASAFHILDAEQVASLDEGKVLTTCDLYEGEPLLVGDEDMTLNSVSSPKQDFHPEKEQARIYCDDEDMQMVEEHQRMTVTDEEGNPLHFTTPDGIRLPVTTLDGKTLQVVTKDGQIIPVEMRSDEELQGSDTIVHHLNIEKSLSDSSPISQYYTII